MISVEAARGLVAHWSDVIRQASGQEREGAQKHLRVALRVLRKAEEAEDNQQSRLEGAEGDPETADDDSELIGKTLQEAAKWARSHGLTVRMIRLNGAPLLGTTDKQHSRINVVVEKGKILEIKGRG